MWLQAQQGQRHANVVVQVALGGQGIFTLPAHSSTQDAGQHLGDGGFAVAAGHGNQWQAELGTPQGGQFAQRTAAVGHLHAGQTGFGQASLGHRCHSTRRSGLGQKMVGIECIAPQSHKQVARTQAAAVGVDSEHVARRRTHGLRTGQARQQGV